MNASFLEAARQEQGSYIEELVLPIWDECQQTFLLNISIPTSAQGILDLFDLYHLHSDLHRRVGTLLPAIKRYCGEEPQKPYNEEDVVFLEFWLEG